MNIWRIQPNINHFSGFYLANPTDASKLRQHPINKGQIISNWQPLPIAIDPSAQLKHTILGDCSLLWNTGMLLVSEQAKLTLQANYSQFIQFLPLMDTNDCPYYILNILAIHEALDEQRSEEYYHFINRDPNRPMIRNISSYALNEKKISAPIFCLQVSDVIRSAFIYVTDAFKNEMEASSLTGFCFRSLD